MYFCYIIYEVMYMEQYKRKVPAARNKEKGFVKGLILGIIYYLLSFVIFSILQAKFSISIKNLYDFLLTTFASGLIGIILVNIKK